MRFSGLSLFGFILLFSVALHCQGSGLDLDVCFNFGCKSQQRIKLKSSEWRLLQLHFVPVAENPEAERRQIAKAVGLMEQMVGAKSPTGQDKGRNQAAGEPGQMDCIDESTNTSRYLRLMSDRGWFKWHRVGERVKRRPLLFDTHWAAVIEELGHTERRYAVDSWFFDNGEPPYIAPLQKWLRGDSPE